MGSIATAARYHRWQPPPTDKHRCRHGRGQRRAPTLPYDKGSRARPNIAIIARLCQDTTMLRLTALSRRNHAPHHLAPLWAWLRTAATARAFTMSAVRSLAVVGSVVAVGVLAIGCTKDGSSNDDNKDCTTLTPITNAAFCASGAPALVCEQVPPRATVEMCGVALPAPPADAALERSSSVKNFAGSGPPQLDCFEPAGYPAAPGTPQLVTMKGIAKIFSHGCSSDNLEIKVYTVKRDGSADDGMPDQLVGAAITTDADCTVNGVSVNNDDCPDMRHECTYEYPNVPTETELIVVTSGMYWAPIYEYNLYIRNDAVVSGFYDKDVRALAQDDYGLVAQVALGSPITLGHGAVAGEVHDCDNVRLVNAVVDVDTPRLVSTYFTDNESNPLPDLDANATSILGLYSAMDIEPGPVTVAAAGIHNGRLVGVGYVRARVFANAITTVTFRGLQPYQLPAP